MKSISVIQPWASLLILGEKRYETRSWPTRHRGLLAIHASLRFPMANQELCEAPHFCSAFRKRRMPMRLKFGAWMPNTQAVPTGAVLGIVWMIGCHRVEDVRDRLSPQELAFGDYSDGRHAWELEVIERFTEPIKARGSLGLWEWSAPEKVWARHGRC